MHPSRKYSGFHLEGGGGGGGGIGGYLNLPLGICGEGGGDYPECTKGKMTAWLHRTSIL